MSGENDLGPRRFVTTDLSSASRNVVQLGAFSITNVPLDTAKELFLRSNNHTQAALYIVTFAVPWIFS